LLPELNEGGIERGVVESNREYSKLGLSSFVISNGGKLEDKIFHDGGRHIRFDVCSKNIFTLIDRVIKLRRILKEIKPDIIHVRSRVPAWLVYLANKSLHIKVVSTVHGFNSIGFYSKIMTKSDAIICVSTSIKEYIQSNYNTNDSIISIIPRGIDTELFNTNNLDHIFLKNFKNQYNLENKFVVSIVGRVTQLKDYETYIKSILEVKKSIPNILGLVVGGIREDKREYLKHLKKLINNLNLDKQIVFTGSQEKVAEVYSLSNVIVSSSKKPESFGRAVAEAISMNTPVVATNHGGVKDIILENENGFFFEVGDYETLSKKIIQAKELKFDGRNYIKKTFSLKKMIDNTMIVYKNME